MLLYHFHFNKDTFQTKSDTFHTKQDTSISNLTLSKSNRTHLEVLRIKSVLFDLESVRFEMESVWLGLESVLIKVEMVYIVFYAFCTQPVAVVFHNLYESIYFVQSLISYYYQINESNQIVMWAKLIRRGCIPNWENSTIINIILSWTCRNSK